MATLKLGSVDENAMPASKKDFLAPYHAGMSVALQNRFQFRDENQWRSFSPVSGKEVQELQQFLKDAGFMPKSNMDGVFGYATQAAVRLFQEYIRTVDGDPSIGTPDGVVGRNTWAHIAKWREEKAGKDNFVCDWGQSSSANPTDEFNRWIRLLNQAKDYFVSVRDTHPIVQLVEQFGKPTDTQKVGDWDVDPNTVHLIGIRTHEDQEVRNERRENDDLFILLINGQVFKFWGSTDPSPSMSSRSEIPFLVEGQHIYRFGWHKLSSAAKIYQALRPSGPGVLVFRDRDGDERLTAVDIAKGFDALPNTTINIHWSGIGTTNFSAGCQVIAGNSYINSAGKLQDCTAFAARNQSGLTGGKTRGAYNVFVDLLMTYAPPGVQTIRYLLGRDESFKNFNDWDNSFVSTDVDMMRRGMV
ncbi:MAG: peptidoglycan-binding protein [Bacteroidetes bacterium]|nr:MAG: peptidoglycan-binding protein [Bacteroidota bacterium]